MSDIRIHRDSQAWAEAAAEFVLEVGKEAVRANGRFFIALSGGTTPEILYRALASPAFADRFDWSRTTFFFSDERCVPPDDPRSNYALADKTLFTPLRITPSQVYRMAGESRDPQAAASEYEQQLRLATKTSPSAQPSLDLILLGLGEDGHTASLFPGTSILWDHQRVIAATQSPKDPPNRLTMTLAVINRASVIMFLAIGTGKAGVVRAILDPKTEAERQLPASLVEPEEGRLIWFLDRAAAAELPIHQQRTGSGRAYEGRMIVAGDIGGTKTHLALFDWKKDRVDPIRLESFHSADYTSLEDMLTEFLVPPKPPSPIDEFATEKGNAAEPEPEPPTEKPPKIDAACFGIAGPVIQNRCQTTNLPWVVDGATLAKQFDIPRVKLLNDLEAMAHGILLLRPDEVEILNAGTPPPHNQALALISAGTGLGESILFWNGSRYQPMPSEGGHADFAPTNDNEIELLRHLRSNYLHVSYERVLSGPGLHAIYDYVRDSKKNEPTWLSEQIKAGDPAAVIAEAGLKGQADIAKQALDLFASIYGAEAGNLALKAMTLNGVYLGGGIAPKLLAKLKDGTFMKAFTNKGRYTRLMISIPVKVVMNDKTALLGAASVAAQIAK